LLQLVFAGAFLAFIGIMVSLGDLSWPLLALYLVSSAVTFCVFALDKSAARKNQWRTRERTLHLMALIGGWPGALIAQKLLHHKSKKSSFQLVFWGTVILNCGTLVWWLKAARSLGTLFSSAP